MLRFRPPFISPASAPAPAPAPTRHHTVTYESVSLTPDATAPCTVEAVCVHVDYDRHPLGVHEYEHYINQAERDERFHIR
jgi:hypothetical protein